MTQSIDELVTTLIAQHKGLAPGSIGTETELTALGIGSLDAITLAYELEEVLGVEVPNTDLESLRTVQDLIDALERLNAQKG